MGVMFCISPCFGCGIPFSFNPNLVPSIRINDVKEPVCEECIDRANIKREELGLPLHKILPGAYEPVDENEVL